MRLTRVLLPQPLQTGQVLQLPEAQARHLTRVLRLEAGAALTVFDGRGGEYGATLERATRGEFSIRLGEHHAIERESPLDITLLQGIARGEKMDLILQKATELGVTRIVPLTTVRSTVRLAGESARHKLAHWQGVVAGACEQCGRNRVPEVAAPVALTAAVQQQPASLKLLLSPGADAAGPRTLLARASAPSIALLVGPEGGFDPDEVRAATLAGFTACRLGPRVLRTETAALAALATLQAVAGDFSN